MDKYENHTFLLEFYDAGSTRKCEMVMQFLEEAGDYKYKSEGRPSDEILKEFIENVVLLRSKLTDKPFDFCNGVGYKILQFVDGVLLGLSIAMTADVTSRKGGVYEDDRK